MMRSEAYRIPFEFCWGDRDASIPISDATLHWRRSQPEALADWRLTFQVTWSQYKCILRHGWLNAQPHVLPPNWGEQWVAEQPVRLEARLHPQQVASLTPYEQTLAQAVACLRVDQHRWSDVDHWLLLTARQSQSLETPICQTFWDYLPPAAMCSGADEDLWAAALTAYFQACLEASMPQETAGAQDLMAAAWADSAIDGVPAFSALAPELEAMVSAMTAAFAADLAPDLAAMAAAETPGAASLFDQMIAFLTGDDWPYEILEPGETVRFQFAGDQGTWICYGLVQPQAEQLLFYSVAPLTVPLDQRRVVSEYVTRLNEGLLLGNFELSFATGDVRFKTSVPAPGSVISQGTIRQLLYANVLTLDQYLPGFRLVLDQGLDPAIAIAHREADSGSNGPV